MSQEFANWRKSSRSATATDNCVEVATAGMVVGVRDSKDRGAGPILQFGAPAWTTFVSAVRDGRHTV